MARNILAWVQPGRAARQHRAYRGSTTTLCGMKLGDTAVWTNRARQPCGECEVKNPERAEFIEFLLDYLADTPEIAIPSAAIETARLTPRFFDGAEPFLRTDLTHGGSDYILDTGAEPENTPWPLDLSLIGRGAFDPEDGDDTPEGEGWFLNRYRSLDARSVRGRVFPSLPYPVEWTHVVPAGKFAHRWILGRAKPHEWVSISRAGSQRQSRLSGDPLRTFWTERMQLALELWKLRPQQWRVYFSIDGRPGIELPSDPVGARAAFRLRDIPDGKSRRSALRHWVSEHWRQNRDAPSEEIKVREHLRGAVDFTWSGLRCKIKPSRVDLDRAEDAREQRDAERSAGVDRRMVR